MWLTQKGRRGWRKGAQMYPEDLLLLVSFTANLIGMALLALVASRRRAGLDDTRLVDRVSKGIAVLVLAVIGLVLAFAMLRLLELAEQSL
ncbi:MAG TPA: hypothetical protein EYH50_03935 [Pyrodictium delaneyi]|uniref:Uncharacterized protein n=1 Tax=Pyrodictium delaneyi TaxID=1273541 RepID=A0A833E8V6_9CREN|nr:hypothetical protein [Pyrodictium delaneyi]